MEDLEKLQDYEKVRGKLRLPAEGKPCLMNMLSESSPELIRHGINAFLLGCELHRVGKTNEQIEAILTKKYIKPSKIRGVIKSVSKNIYNYKCSRLEELGLCLYEEQPECWWFDKLPKESQREGNERDFWRYHWPERLRRTEECLYLALRSIEMKREYQAGSKLFVSWNELHKESRVTKCIIGKKLEALRKIGLVKYKPGEERRKGSRARATEVTRIIPIPRPSNSQDTE